MRNMLKADFYRLVHSKGFFFCLIFILGLTILGASSAQVVAIGMGGEIDLYTNESFVEKTSQMKKEEINALDLAGYRDLVCSCKDYDFDKDYMSFNVNLFYAMIFLGVVTIAGDFSNSSIKNTLSSAISRKRYFASKLVFMAIVCNGVLFLSNISIYLFNRIFNGGAISSTFGNVIRMSIMQLPEALAFSAMLSGLAFITKKTAFFNGVTIPLIIIGQMLLSIAAFAFSINEKYLKYELSSMMRQLIHDPSSGYLRNAYLLCAGIIAAFTALGWLAFRKTEIK